MKYGVIIVMLMIILSTVTNIYATNYYDLNWFGKFTCGVVLGFVGFAVIKAIIGLLKR